VYRPGDPAGDSLDRVAPGALRLAFGVSVLPGPATDGDPRAAASYAPGGAGGRWTAAGIADALAQARQARRLAALLGGGARLVDAAEVGSVDLLLAAVPGEARRAFRAGLLTPLLDYDREHGTELVRTLRVFLDCSGSWTKAADAIFVHVNSLRYRIRRVEELTGRDLGSLADQAALLLALRLDDSAED
jgi:DNA-binding PucR family transcriptional regulator